jgi:DNA-binding NarL/FixJ family response regulator
VGQASRLAAVVTHAGEGPPLQEQPLGAGPGDRTRRGEGPGRSADRRARVLVADRHEATRTGLRLVLEEAGFDVCGECGDGRTVLRLAGREQPDVCVVEDRLPDGDEPVADVLVGRPGPPRVVVLAGVADASQFFAAIRGGAHGYLLRTDSAEALVECVRTVAAGGAYVGQPFLTRIVEEFRSGRHLAAGEPSPREREVLVLLGGGLTTKGVAAELGLSATTVRRHVSSALSKLGCDDRTEALERLGVQRESERR